jgi:peptidoglycan hydrolase CwlO-like protein
MVNLPKERLREAAVLLCVLAVAFVFASTSLRGQVQRGAIVSQIDPCVRDAQSPACLQSRITKLEAQLGELQQNVVSLQNKMRTVDSIGDPKVGKDDGYDDIWTAIQRLTNDINELKKR